MNETYECVAVKRDWVPAWLYRLFNIQLPFLGQPSLILPFRMILHRELSDQTRRDLEQGLRDIKAGRTTPLDEIWRKLQEPR